MTIGWRHDGLSPWSIYRDHTDTWTVRVGEEGREDHRRAWRWNFLPPFVAAAPFLAIHVHLWGLGQLLAGVALFTALLFGLLALVFNVGLTLRKDANVISNAHGLRQVVSDLRANITWAILVAFILAVCLVTAAAVTDPAKPAGWGFTPLVVLMFVHLVLTLASILSRFRTAFNYVTR